MQTWPNAFDFETLLDHFFELTPLTGTHRKKLRNIVATHARTILTHADVKYMPAFKVMDLISEMVSHAVAIDEERQLREVEALKLLEAEFAPAAPLLRGFMLEAALERARYEPLMMIEDFSDAADHRAGLLSKRWHAMLDVHRDTHMLPEPWLDAVNASVESVIADPSFKDYRVGPLLQMFAEMLQYARQLHETHLPVTALASHVGKDSPLWKRYKLKAKRFRESEGTSFDVIPTDSLRFPKHLQ